MYPENYRYTKEHEWIDAQGSLGIVGITHHAQEKLGDIVFVELPKVGRQLAVMESFGTVESVKAVSDLFSPASGEVVEINTALADNPALLNQSPHQAGWLIKIRLSNLTDLKALLSAKDYEEFVHRSEEAES